MARLAEEDLRFFADVVKDFFAAATRKPATVSAAYLATEALPEFEFTGVITLAGAYRGQLRVSAPRVLLRDFVLNQGETDTSERNLLDAVGEIANTVAGNARRRFGAGLDISVPQRLKGMPADGRARVRQHPFVIALRWVHHEALVCVDLEKAD